MLETKMFEIRDRATFIAAIGIQMSSSRAEGAERFLLRRSGYGDEPLVWLTKIGSHPEMATYSPYEWPNGRTMGFAHRYITDHWSELQSGDVVDVEFLRGEKSVPKKSEVEDRPFFLR